jgi:thiamine-monophosphate kinase
MGSWQVARKSIVACVSDLAAKGVKPHAAMISLGLPRNSTRPYVEGLAEGFARASKEFGVRIVGGDTNEANDLVIDCTMLGFANRKVPPRTGAKPGDLVLVSGLFGLPAAGLALLMRNAAGKGAFTKEAIESVLEPLPRPRFGLTLAKFFSSSIDSSDGLATSLYELAAGSSVDIFVDSVPVAAGVEEFALKNNIDQDELIFHGGEEYEIVATIPKSKQRPAQAAARRAKLDIHIIGRVSRGRGRVYVGNKLLANRGYIHFNRR